MSERRNDTESDELTGVGEALAGDPARREDTDQQRSGAGDGSTDRPADQAGGRPSQAEGEDPADEASDQHPEQPGGHPSQAEGEREDGA